MKKAFTLIELLIVVAIIGILAGVGIPMYNGYMASAKVASAKTNHSNVIRWGYPTSTTRSGSRVTNVEWRGVVCHVKKMELSLSKPLHSTTEARLAPGCTVEYSTTLLSLISCNCCTCVQWVYLANFQLLDRIPTEFKT